MLAMFLDMVGDIGRCWFLYVIVLQFWAVLGNVEQCWQLLDITKAAARLCVPAFFCVTLLREAPVYFSGLHSSGLHSLGFRVFRFGNPAS